MIDASDGSTLAAGLVGAPLPLLEDGVESCTGGGVNATPDDHALVSPGP